MLKRGMKAVQATPARPPEPPAEDDQALIDFDALRTDFAQVRAWLIGQEGWTEDEVAEVAADLREAKDQADVDRLRAFVRWLRQWVAVVEEAAQRCRAAEERMRIRARAERDKRERKGQR